MIYQCYFQDGQTGQCFNREPYVNFGLEPSVNPEITHNCPELEDAWVRRQLVEYACMLWHWRNPDADRSGWIGLTSYRQLGKGCDFSFSDSMQVTRALASGGIAAWGGYEFHDRNGQPVSLQRQAEFCHQGINAFTRDVLARAGIAVPAAYDHVNSGYLANYWVMDRQLFDAYMAFSWPLCLIALDMIRAHAFSRQQAVFGTVSPEKCVGYFLERLFVIWYLQNGYEITDVAGLKKQRVSRKGPIKKQSWLKRLIG